MAPGVPETGFQRFLKNRSAPYVGMIIAFAFGILFLYLGIASMFCGSFIVGIFLYIIPKTFGADWKKMAVFGVLFLVVASVFSAYAITKPSLLSMEGDHSAGDFQNVSVNPFRESADGTYDISVDFSLAAGETFTSMSMEYGEVQRAHLQYITAKDSSKTSNYTLAGNTYTFNQNLDSGKVYYYKFIVEYKDTGGNEQTKNSLVFIGPITADDGGVTALALTGNLYFIGLYVVLIFFLILLLTTFMRSRLEKTREKLEAEGRLYPQGYGRCKTCGTMVLPGEVVCRKCGAYIDVPEEFKPKKVEYFECSECGKEVPADAKACPVCGEPFDGEETEVFYDGEDTGFICSECGRDVPADARRCPSCGKEFED